MNQDKIWHYFQSESTEVFRNSEGRLKFLALKIRRRTKNRPRVLNIGIGGGLFEEQAIKLNLDVYSMDPDAESIARLEKHPEMKGRTKVGDLQLIPFAGEAFDAVVVSEVLEHLNDTALEKALSEIHRVLLPGGFIIGTVPARENLIEQLVVCPHCDEKFHRWGHLQSFDKARMTTLLAKYFQVDVVAEKYLDAWSQLNWKGKAVSIVKRSMAVAGVMGAGNSLYFSAIKK